MTNPYSGDRLDRTTPAIKLPDTAYESLAAKFFVGRGSVNRIRRLYRRTGEM